MTYQSTLNTNITKQLQYVGMTIIAVDKCHNLMLAERNGLHYYIHQHHLELRFNCLIKKANAMQSFCQKI